MKRKRCAMKKRLVTAVAAALCVGGALPAVGAGDLLPVGPAWVARAEAAKADGYVDRTVRPSTQQTLSLSSLSIPQQVTLSDPAADACAVRLAAYLAGVANSDALLYGHQNDLHRKVATQLPGASDTMDVTGSNAAVLGVDSLALTGAELELTDAERAAGVTLSEKLARIYGAEAKHGAILTMSLHLPNFAQVAQRPKVDGKYDFSGYSPNDLSGNVVRRILPGGDLNEVYTAYLDLVADFAGRLRAEDIPLIFRPLHENNGSWFWWGASSCSPSEFKTLFRYTVAYLREEKGLHNLVTAYSPNGPFAKESDYMDRYPGDAWVDILGMDYYHRFPAAKDTWMESMESSMRLVEDLAARHGKSAALTETGIIAFDGGCLKKSGNPRLKWYDELLDHTKQHRISYALTWANFFEENFCQPYLVDGKRGHELVDSFTRFYNAPETVFQNDNADWSKISANAVAVTQHPAYITQPQSFTRILGAARLTAAVHGAPSSVAFAVTADGTDVLTLPAAPENGRYAATLSHEQLQAIGARTATLRLLVDGKEADAVPDVLFNQPEKAADPLTVDDFETYGGSNSILASAYAKNAGSGDVTWTLSGEKGDGAYGLSFHYSLSPSGYAGIVKPLGGADWSKASALELWVKPDGQGQRLIVQVNSGGEDFEVELQSYLKGTAPQLVRIPFADFRGKQGGKFNPKSVRHFALYCNQVGTSAVDSTVVFDAIRAVK